ncbi:alpha-amylase [Aspergillus alliaceus]|uniref:alpha-amylase n=1 Tax=Petromyces alliaceus TaxID=209559 RepID=UPI0012A41EA6|nr:alpha-amylase A type-3 [Aspergillus alliaceus]KAB8239457.1 alpha-amylase A type-3 [Aspergillus alliaceus]
MVSWWSFLLYGLQAAAPAFAATPEDWRSQSIYFLLTDRFARTDGSTSATCNTEDRRYCGGTWKGIIDKLDYIQGMGFTAIWITPVTGQLPQNTAYGEAYHGYWQQDIYALNSHYGTADDLKALSSALHKRGMYLMVDVVANHMGYDGAGNSVDYSVFKPFNSEDYFHPFCLIQNYNDQTQAENCWLGDNTVSLPDLDTTRQDVKNEWYEWVGALVSNYSIDGLRIDTVKHVQKDFWPGYNKAAGVYCIGEVLDGNPAYTCPYQKVLDGVLNYPMYYPLLNAFKSTSGNMNDLYNMINTVKSDCPDSTLMGTFIENHDNPRFASYTRDISLAKNVAAFTILADGIPIIYAGQEQQYAGGNDPANREATWLSGYSTTSEIYKLLASVNAIRSHAISTDKSYLTYKNWPIYKDDTTIAMRKGSDGSQVITVLSNKGANGDSYTLSLENTGYTAGQKLTEVVTCSIVTVGSDGKVPVPMEKGLPRVLYPSEKLGDSKICSK